MGCRFPADPAYAPELARHGEAVGVDLARRGCTGRASVDFVAARRAAQPWDVRAIEVNLRKGGTTHPYTALRNLVPGRYDTEAGVWRADAGGNRGLPLHRLRRRSGLDRTSPRIGRRRRPRGSGSSSTSTRAPASSSTCSPASPSTAGSARPRSGARRRTPRSCSTPCSSPSPDGTAAGRPRRFRAPTPSAARPPRRPPGRWRG